MERRDTGITLIAIGKLAKAVILVMAGVCVLGGDPPHSIAHAAAVLRIDPHSHFVHAAIAEVTRVDPARLRQLGAGSFLYAALFLTESLGLWFRKRWAEWLTLIITASFVPFEVWEIIHRASVAKVLVLVLNIAAVIYLAIRRVKRRDPKFTSKRRMSGIAA